MKEVEITRHETKHQVARQYAKVYNNGDVEIRRNVRTKLTGIENDMPENRLTVTELKALVVALEDTASLGKKVNEEK